MIDVYPDHEITPVRGGYHIHNRLNGRQHGLATARRQADAKSIAGEIDYIINRIRIERRRDRLFARVGRERYHDALAEMKRRGFRI